LDENLFRVGKGLSVGPICVATRETLLMCKAATLVSRCTEKDLYDLWWFREQGADLSPQQLVCLGSKIDAGMDAESVLISLTSTALSETACDFALAGGPTVATTYQRIVALKAALETAFGDYLENLPPPPLAKTLRRLKRLR
jgi:hypothetical protein